MSYISTLWGDPVTKIVLVFLLGVGICFMAYMVVEQVLAYRKRQRASRRPRVMQFTPNTPLGTDLHHR